ncbi:MAG TPA: DNA methyltransferase [Acidimicrobiales bacterium]|nr:DNA methyltransferase [Acidimicrobiales bacterium]
MTELALKFTTPTVDRSFDQTRLDLTRRARTSLFPWRGQFSPELVEFLLEELPSDGLLVDPFVGSGTTLFECGRLGIDALGAEINPAAVSFAVLSELTSLERSERMRAADDVLQVLQRLPNAVTGGLFDDGGGTSPDYAEIVKSVATDLGDTPSAAIFRAALLLAMGHKPHVDLGHVRAEVSRLRRVLATLPVSSGCRRAVAADARQLPLDDCAASGAVTSPPYINVFNYHQQYRPAVELLGAGPLSVARAEIGANRKHRQNRFLTVVQYGLDIEASLQELHRVLISRSIAKFVVGRESNVRGVAFRNGRLIAAIAEGSGMFVVERWQERRFTTRFGESIYEDILTLRSRPHPTTLDGFHARSAAVWELEQACQRPLDRDVKSDLEAAIAGAEAVTPSPLFDPDAVPWLKRPSFFTPLR